MGVNKWSHHSNFPQVLGIPSVDDDTKNNALKLYENIFKTNTPSRDLQSILQAHFTLKGITLKWILLDSVLRAGVYHLDLITGSSPSTGLVYETVRDEDGLVETFQLL